MSSEENCPTCGRTRDDHGFCPEREATGTCNAGCDKCGIFDREEGSKFCASCAVEEGYRWYLNQGSVPTLNDASCAVEEEPSPGQLETLDNEVLRANSDQCDACGRSSIDCSQNPCAAVLADRES